MPKKIEKIISFLCSDSGSHDYAIYRNEAKHELGLNIIKPDDEQYKCIKKVFNSIREELELLTPFIPSVILGGQTRIVYKSRRVLLESINRGTDVYVSEGEIQKQIQTINQPGGLPPINRNTVQQQPIFEGWRYEKATN